MYRKIWAALLCVALAAPAYAGEFTGLAEGILALHRVPTPGPVIPIVPPTPPPPAPGQICPNCKGTGKLGDGTIAVECPLCNGTGRIAALPPPIRPAVVTPVIPAPALRRLPAAVPAPVRAVPRAVYRTTTVYGGGNCANGQCSQNSTNTFSFRRRGRW